jgi:hypothetical protein
MAYHSISPTDLSVIGKVGRRIHWLVLTSTRPELAVQ